MLICKIQKLYILQINFHGTEEVVHTGYLAGSLELMQPEISVIQGGVLVDILDFECQIKGGDFVPFHRQGELHLLCNNPVCQGWKKYQL